MNSAPLLPATLQNGADPQLQQVVTELDCLEVYVLVPFRDYAATGGWRGGQGWSGRP